MIISKESIQLYEEFKFINLNDKLQRNDLRIRSLIAMDFYFKDKKTLYMSVLKFLGKNRTEILSKIDKKKEYIKIIKTFNIVTQALSIVHLNQIVNEFGQENFDNKNL